MDIENLVQSVVDAVFEDSYFHTNPRDFLIPRNLENQRDQIMPLYRNMMINRRFAS